MICKQLKNGSWECVADGPRDPVTNKRNQIRRRGRTQSIAKTRVTEEINRQKEYGIDGKKVKKMTFEKTAWQWLSVYRRGKRKKGTVRIREKEIKVLLRYISKINIADVTPNMHQKILNDLDDKGYAKSTIEGVHTTAGMIYKYAIKEKLIKFNPAAGAVIPKKLLTVEEIENTTIDDEYLEYNELEEFLSVTVKHGMEYDVERFYLLAFSGMRSGELCALKWTDINFEKNEIRITKTLYNPNSNMKEYEITPPKTPASIRTFEVDEEIMELLKVHKREQAKMFLRTAKDNQNRHNANFVFCRANGYPFIQKNLQTRMARILKKTTITKHATPHIFRHTHISMLAEAGVDLATIMKRVGHDDADTTMRIYTHVTEKMKKDATEKVSIHFGNILKNANSKIM
ncbi:tyrosine-type recombinase/integrase [Sporosarcina jiandibaonis]|uniref:tyrosine-type recombinase/integrase n=1 Tax=Sporosarcina jiandibaonis TaxID=2715535 RepID=UPI001556806D|nr:tyrosine-type recombinase/integrase [Sporosarcina jiandibaonis]